MYKNFSELQEHARRIASRKRVAVAAAEEEHLLEAVNRAYLAQLIEPTLIGDAEKIARMLDSLGADIPRDAIIPADTAQEAALFAVKLARSGAADILMKGRLHTAELMRIVVDRADGLRAGNIISHLAFLELPTYHKLLAITDSAIVLSPHLEEKQAILENAVRFMLKMGYQQPNAAVMAAVETVNPRLRDTVDAARLKRLNQEGVITDCVVEGPISYDLAMSRESARIKRYHSPVTGEVDVMLVPDMTAGNLMAKSLVYSGGAKMAGVIVGAAAPIVLTSRGSSADEKFYSLVLAASAASRQTT